MGDPPILKYPVQHLLRLAPQDDESLKRVNRGQRVGELVHALQEKVEAIDAGSMVENVLWVPDPKGVQGFRFQILGLV